MTAKILQRDDETFAPRGSSIRVQLALRLFLARIRETPRWQPRGHDTQSFRPLVQEEEVSSRARVLARRLRVNSLEPRAAGCVADSILFERKLTRMKTNSFVRSMALLAAMALAVSALSSRRAGRLLPNPKADGKSATPSPSMTLCCSERTDR